MSVEIAGHRLQVDHLVGCHAPFLDDLGNGDLLVLHAVVHRDVFRHELHKVLVGGDDCHIRAGRFRKPGVGGDKVVRLEPFLFDAGQVESAGGVTDKTELRDQVFRRRRAVRLVAIVEIVTERLGRIVEDDGEMRRSDADGSIARVGQKLPQHVAEARDRIDRQAVRLAVQGRDGVERPEDEPGAVDEEEMIAFFHGDKG